MASGAGVYTVVVEAQTVATAITVLELTAPSTGMIRIFEAWATQTGLTASTRARMQILRKTGTITGTATPPTARPAATSQPAFGGTVKWIATNEGTDGVILHSEAFDDLYGWYWKGGTEDDDKGLWVPPSGIVALKHPASPSSASRTYGFKIKEYG